MAPYNNTSLLDANATQPGPTTAGEQLIEPHEEPPQLTILSRIVFSVVILTALAGNMIVIHAIRNGPSRKPFTHYLVTSLAVAELINAVCLPFLFIYDEGDSGWIFGQFLCTLVLPMMLVSFFVVTMTLAAIAVYRYRVVVTPHKRRPSPKIMLGTVVVTWVISFAFAVPSFARFTLEAFPGYYLCYEKPPLVTYHLVRFVIHFCLPALIMILAYGVVFLHIRQHMTFLENRRQARLYSNVSSINTYVDSQAPAYGGDNNHLLLTAITPRSSINNINRLSAHAQLQSTAQTQTQDIVQAQANQKESTKDEGNIMESERDVIKMFYVIVLIFLVCYIPYQVFFLLSHFEVIGYYTWRHYYLFKKYSFLLTCLPSALHPMCYGTMSKFYARAFSKFILCKCRKQSE